MFVHNGSLSVMMPLRCKDSGRDAATISSRFFGSTRSALWSGRPSKSITLPTLLLISVHLTFEVPFKKNVTRRIKGCSACEGNATRHFRRRLNEKRPDLSAKVLTLIRRGMAGKVRAGSAIKDDLLVKSILNKLILISVMPSLSENGPCLSREK